MPHAPLFQIVLQQVAPVVHRLRGLDLKVHSMAQFVDLSEDFLELLA